MKVPWYSFAAIGQRFDDMRSLREEIAACVSRIRKTRQDQHTVKNELIILRGAVNAQLSSYLKESPKP
jgi:hypothetical protein